MTDGVLSQHVDNVVLYSRTALFSAFRYRKLPVVASFFASCVYGIWSCSNKSTLGQKSALMFWFVIIADVLQLSCCAGDHTFVLINAVLIVQNKPFWAILKDDPQPFANFQRLSRFWKSHVVAMHFLAFIMRTGANINAPYKYPGFGPTKRKIFFFSL